MKEQNQQDEFLHSLFKEVEVKEDLGITEKVMHQIQENPSLSTIAYKPPISKLGWTIIISVFVGLLSYAFLHESSFAVELPTYAVDLSVFLNQLKNSFSLNPTLPTLPSLSVPYLAAILAFNVAGMYFILSYWRSRRV